MLRWISALVLVIIDHILKLFALLALVPGTSLTACTQSTTSTMGGLFVVACNYGATFGLFQGANTVMLIVSIAATALVIWLVSKANTVDAIPLSMLLAGIIGNGIDRAVRGAVVDYIRIGWWPVFNFADMLIVTGIILVIVLEIPIVKIYVEAKLCAE